MQQIHGLLEKISRRAVWAGGLALLIAAFIVTVDVLMRKFFSITMSGSDEVSGYVFAASTTWAYSFCLLHRANVRIDAFYNFLPRPVKAVLDVVGAILLLLYMGILTQHATNVFLESWANGSVSVTTLQTPLWIPQLLWIGGLYLFMLTLIFVCLHSLIGLLSGNLNRVQMTVGVRSLEDEIMEETHGMGANLKTGGA
jgi:TRAP-type C4-dicarboxylate transport system permease small subunit